MSVPGFRAEASLYKVFALYRATNGDAHAGDTVHPAQFSMFSRRPQLKPTTSARQSLASGHHVCGNIVGSHTLGLSAVAGSST